MCVVADPIAAVVVVVEILEVIPVVIIVVDVITYPFVTVDEGGFCWDANEDGALLFAAANAFALLPLCRAFISDVSGNDRATDSCCCCCSE